MPKPFKTGASQRRERSPLTSSRFYKFITPKTIESGEWMLQAPRQLSNMNRQYPTSVMVWGGIRASGKTPLAFVEEGVKTNHKVYWRDINEAVVLPWAQTQIWKFKLDASTRLYASLQSQKGTEWCKANFPDMISSEE
ncbi:DDE_3 domain-containing protein [Trichonephila clavipes]|nr:DDE_3 domain-containing protein [Trichonephila clavipes]